ncbi:MAG: hypothetical protein U1E59_01325 [Amaricoccus sp.]
MIRALLLVALLVPGLAGAENLTLSFVPHPRHDTVIAGEMVPVTLRAVYDRKVAREKLEIAASDSFDWLQTAPDRWMEEEIDGKSRIVMERDLAIVPKRAGVLHFGPATHTLTIIDEASQRQDRVVTAPPMTLSVGAYPAERGWMWVADDATLSETLSTDPSRLADGQTVTRTVTLRARGTLPEALPPRPVVSEPWLISFAAPIETRLILTADGPVSEAVWTWQLRPETGEPGVIPPVKIPFFDATTREIGNLEIPPLPIGYASFYTNRIETGRFGPGPRLAEAAALLAGVGAGAALILARRVPVAGHAIRGHLRRLSPVRRRRLSRALRDRDLLAARRLLAETRPDAHGAAALLDAAIYGRARIDPDAFRRALQSRSDGSPASNRFEAPPSSATGSS